MDSVRNDAKLVERFSGYYCDLSKQENIPKLMEEPCGTGCHVFEKNRIVQHVRTSLGGIVSNPNLPSGVREAAGNLLRIGYAFSMRITQRLFGGDGAMDLSIPCPIKGCVHPITLSSLRDETALKNLIAKDKNDPNSLFNRVLGLENESEEKDRALSRKNHEISTLRGEVKEKDTTIREKDLVINDLRFDKRRLTDQVANLDSIRKHQNLANPRYNEQMIKLEHIAARVDTLRAKLPKVEAINPSHIVNSSDTRFHYDHIVQQEKDFADDFEEDVDPAPANKIISEIFDAIGSIEETALSKLVNHQTKGARSKDSALYSRPIGAYYKPLLTKKHSHLPLREDVDASTQRGLTNSLVLETYDYLLERLIPYVDTLYKQFHDQPVTEYGKDSLLNPIKKQYRESLANYSKVRDLVSFKRDQAIAEEKQNGSYQESKSKCHIF